MAAEHRIDEEVRKAREDQRLIDHPDTRPGLEALLRWLDGAIAHADEFGVTEVTVHVHMLRLTREALASPSTEAGAWDEAMRDPAFVAAVEEGLRDVAAGRVTPFEDVLPSTEAGGLLRPADIDLFDQRIEANRQRPSIAGLEALVTDLRAALASSSHPTEGQP